MTDTHHHNHCDHSHNPSCTIESIEIAPADGPISLQVNPQKVNLSTLGLNSDRRPTEIRRQLLTSRGITMSGDWDRGAWGTKIAEVESLDVYKALKACLLGDRAWQTTPFFQRIMRMIEKGDPKWGCASESELIHRLDVDVRHLYEDIRDTGFKTQGELNTKRPEDEIRVGICRDGRFLLFDGRHRLIIARLLGLPKVPVRLVARHQDWVIFKRSIIDFIDKRLRGRVYQAIDHPDLEYLPAKHGLERISLIERGLEGVNPNGKKLLDIGAHWGYMSQKMTELGFDVTAIEYDREYAEFARRLGVATESSYRVWEGNLLDFQEDGYEVVLALSIFHHMIKTRAKHERLKRLLQRLSPSVLIFEPHDPVLSGEQMKGAYRNYTPEEFVSFVGRYSELPSVEYIGTPNDRYTRPIYKLSR